MSQDDLAYDNTHRAFLQVFIARGTLTFPEARPLLAAILTAQGDDREVLEGDISEADFNNYVTAVNAAISPYDLEIRSAWTQASPRTRIYALVNTTSDAITQLATTHTPDEIAYVKRLLDEMFDKNNTPNRELMAVTAIRAIQLNRSDGPSRRASGANADAQGATAASLTVDHAERLLASLVHEGWLERSRDYYTLSTRALMELRGWLLETYNEPPDDDDDNNGVERIKQCQACRDIVTIGQRCATRACPARLHEHCTQTFFRAQRGSSRCPLCKEEWSGRDLVGPKAAGTAAAGAGTDAGGGGRRRTGNGVAGTDGAGGSSARVSRTNNGAEDDEDDD